MVEAGASSRDLPLRSEGEIEAPVLVPPLTRMSTIREWATNPEAWEAMKGVLGAYGETLMPEVGEPEESLAVFLWDMPPFKVPVMFPGSMNDEQLDDLLARFGG